jgi:RecB family endonuclease NucS
VTDPEGKAKHDIETGWFPITKIEKWDATLPYELVKEDLSNQNYRLRIAKAKEEDLSIIQLALRVYQRLGYGSTDGEFFVLESGLEEAVKSNLRQLHLRMADEAIQQQCNLGLGIGRTDLICLDEREDFVVLELKAVHSSDSVVGQLLRYMGYVRENWAEKAGKKVRGIILTPSYDEQLRLAAKEAGIQVLRVRIQ